MSTRRNLPYLDKADPWSSHSQIRALLEPLPPGTRVLDVGTASGTLGRMCAGQKFILHGIEPNCEWADLCRSFYQAIVCATLDEAPDDFLCDHDAIVCADVLEHMPTPQAALQRLVALQPGGALFFISVPNIANLYVRLSLLAGRFEYAERGILDRTHLRFFTRRTFLEMVEQCGLRVRRLSVTPVPLPLVHPFFERSAGGKFLYTMLAVVTRLFPTLLGYQFIVKAEKPIYEREPKFRE